MEGEIMSLFDDQDQQRSSSDGYKHVPWLSWDEWDAVRDSIFSSSADRVHSALDRISTWRIRGSLPAAIEVTASIIEIQQKDGFIIREKQPMDALYSENLLQMLYCMAILRLVNCVIEKTRRRTEVSIAEAAKAIGIPRKLIDLRHEGSHRELPALSVLRDAAYEALDWLKSYYWEPQKNQIPFNKGGKADLRREIKSKLHKLAFCLQSRQNPQLCTAEVKKKCSKKRIRKILNVLVELYSSFSSEVVSVLLELLLKGLASSNSMDLLKQSEASQDLGGLLHEWELVILEFSNKEPELLLTLLQAVVDMIEKRENRRYETGDLVSEFKEATQVEHLSFLFAWLVSHLKGLKHLQHSDSSRTKASNTVLMELLCQCLLLSAFANAQLMNSALQLAELMGGSVSKEKVRKLSLLCMPPLSVTEEHNSVLISPQTLVDQEKALHDAAKKLEFLNLKLSKKISTGTKETTTGISKRWVKAKFWNPCPIGMLPQVLGSSGRLPLLDCNEIPEMAQSTSNSKDSLGLKPCSSKREAECGVEQLDYSSLKRAKDTVENCESDGRQVDLSTKGVNGEIQQEKDLSLMMGVSKENLRSEDQEFPLMEQGIGCLMTGGAWKRVSEDELLAIASSVRILV